MVSNSRVRSLADARERREPCRVLMTLAGEGRAGRRPAGVTHVPMASLRGWLVFLWQTSLQRSFVHFPTSKKRPA
jgi:hypothetical protein